MRVLPLSQLYLWVLVGRFRGSSLHPAARWPFSNEVLPVFKLSNQEVNDFYSAQGALEIPGVPKLNPRALVDGQRAIQFLKTLPVTSDGRRFELHSKVVDVFDKGQTGTVVKTQFELTDVETGDVYTRITGSEIYIGQGGWNGPRGPKQPACPPPSDRQPDKTLTFDVPDESAHLYRYTKLAQSCT
jgi:peroxisomal enoyl-CoA hydratase 2